MKNTESIDNYADNQLLTLCDSSNIFNAGNSLISNQIPADYYSNPSTEGLCLYLDEINLGSSHPFNIGNEDIFANTYAAISTYYLHNQQNTQYPAEEYNSINSAIYNPWCNMVIPTYTHPFAGGAAQYLTPPLEQAINHAYIPGYNNSQERRKRRKSRVDKDASLSLKNKICANCTTTVAPTWRRDKSRLILLCNACGLYEKLHDGHRQTIIENGVIKLARKQDNNKKKKNTFKRSSIKCKLCNEIFTKNINSGDISIQLCDKCSTTDG
ncbi:hypothetical protein CONCODRAFT_70863 [Conidiobolus coronatus NRRL 28638]|uniref:GATA-type domain-containing protein n=1 Tax=Conidiobolus coronatus (strain ATCC 28846 / CBS 209.66 / NRRL 28638) TaxID=796925 RepID=A0A137P5L7_CONC2|nr:hypothetical protein CONCODRAFT_70863 [Conidiobolus coronatus NRRL 28638]|eukprot:KXN70224.1 hypothetical protein CONCODRAFT_70863 [Conidiobolus coronatus NRRL 28638]